MRTGEPITATVWRGDVDDVLRMEEDRGAFFSSDRDYASQYGPVLSAYEVSLSNPVVVSQAEAEGTMEIDRRVLTEQGHDGRIVLYDDGSFDLICFELAQARLLDSDPDAAPRP